MNKFMIGLVIGGSLILSAATASAQQQAYQGERAGDWGVLGGMNSAHARACGLTPRQVEYVQGEHKRAAIAKVGNEQDFENIYRTEYARVEREMLDLQRRGVYTPAESVCDDLKQQAAQGG